MKTHFEGQKTIAIEVNSDELTTISLGFDIFKQLLDVSIDSNPGVTMSPDFMFGMVEFEQLEDQIKSGETIMTSEIEWYFTRCVLGAVCDYHERAVVNPRYYPDLSERVGKTAFELFYHSIQAQQMLEHIPEVIPTQ